MHLTKLSSYSGNSGESAGHFVIYITSVKCVLKEIDRAEKVREREGDSERERERTRKRERAKERESKRDDDDDDDDDEKK